MMMRILLMITFAALLASCRSTRKIQSAITKKDTAGTTAKTDSIGWADSLVFIRNVLQQIEANRIRFQTFSAKIDMDYRDDAGKKYDLNANIRMQSDSAIWISVSAVLGIEAMRVLITKDSVKLLDKLNKTYTARSVDYLQDVTALPMDLGTLQNLIIGNPVFFDTANIVSYSNRGDIVSLLSVGQWFKNLITVSEEDKTLRGSKLDDLNVARNRTADLAYRDYENKKGVRFATERNIVVAEKKKLDVNLKFKQYDFNEEISFPFNVPKNYERR